MAEISFARALARVAEREPDRPSLVVEEEVLRAAELEAGANRLARAWRELGVEAGDLVTIALPNGAGHVLACLACWKLGAVPNPISARLPERERLELVELANPALVVGVPEGSYPGRVCLPEDFEADPSLPDGPLPDRISPHAQALTSGGSTGRPKLILDAKPGLLDPEEPFYGIRVGSRVLVPGPLFHAGPFLNTRHTLLRGGTVVLMRRFDPRRALELLERHRIEWVNMVPTMLQRIWRLPAEERERVDLGALERLMVSGAACPPWLKRAFIDWLGPERVWEAYGGSERIGGTAISGTEWLERPGSVGRPTGGGRVRILDPEGRDLPPGEVGEVYFRPPGGPGSTYRYVGAEGRVTPDGWETLGDLGWVDEDGYLYLADRRTDLVVTGGENVYPAEVEAAIDEHPAVLSSAVIGLPDDDLGQRVHAIVEVQGELDEPELRAHLAERLAPFKIPRSFEFTRERLRDDAGKVRRPALREARLARTARRA